MARDYNIRPSEKFLQAWIDEFLKQNNAEKWIDVNKHQRYRFIKDVIPRIRQFEKDTKGLVSRQELAKLLGVDNDYLRSISKSADYGPTGKPNVRYRIFQDIIGPSKKIYRPVTGANEGFYKKPPKAAIEAFKKANRSSTILPVMTERVNAFVNSKPFMKMLRTKNLTDPDFLKKTQRLFPRLNLTDQKVADGILYIARGAKGDEFLGATIKKDLPLHKRLIKQFESSKWGNPLHAAAYKFARTEIDQQLGTKEGTFRTYQKKLSQALKDLGIKNFKNYEVDEFVGTSIGGKQKVGPYSVFSRYVSEAVNAGPGAAYQGALSRASVDLQDIIKTHGKGSTEAISFVKDFNKNQAAAFEAKHGIKAARLDLGMPEDVFGKRRYGQLGKIGEQMTEVVKEKGFGYKLPKGALTQKEALKAPLQILETPDLIKKINASPLKKIVEARVGCADGCLAQVAKNEPGKITRALETLPQKAKGFLGMLGRGGVRAAPYAAVAAAGVLAEPLVKRFRNDDPTTYMTDPDQQKGVLLSLVEAETPQVDEEILNWQYPGMVAGAAAAVPGSSAVYKARRKPFKTRAAMGPARAALGPVGKFLAGSFSPLGVAASLPVHIAAQVKGGAELEDIATDPLNWVGPAFASTGAKAATRGMSKTGILSKALRMGMSPAGLRVLSRGGIFGLLAAGGLKGYDIWENSKYK